MKISEAWLREWVNPSLSRQKLCQRLTMAGLEVDDVLPAAKPFTKVIVAKIVGLQPHPQAEHLSICEVQIAKEKAVTVVCGATDLQVDMKVPLALPQATLANAVIIQENVIRGVTSQGMLCSASDLGLAEKSEGLFLLPADAPLGKDCWRYLQLNDYILDIAVTPNRGDCLSVKGLARELAALTSLKLNSPATLKIKPKPTLRDTLPVLIKAPACSHYVGRVIRGLQTTITPMWMQERLRRSGLRSVNLIVDITNYVMLELGQPLHAFDLARVEKNIHVRMAMPEEELMLLDGTAITLDEKTLIIADAKKPLAIAGVMGGLDSGISAQTTEIFLESAFFNPSTIARQRQRYQLNSEAAYRFERGVDPDVQVSALERATELLLTIAGGQAGPLVYGRTKTARRKKPARILRLRREFLINTLGELDITDKEIKDILERLGFSCQKEKQAWRVKVPSWRFDIGEEIDLVEEIARLHGYDKIGATRPVFATEGQKIPENRIPLTRVRQLLCALGYHEVITYSFIDEERQQQFNPDKPPKVLVNPITAEMSVMRTNLWPGLIGAYLYNRDRQQVRSRFFETGLCFQEDQQLSQLGGLISGSALPEQWGQPLRKLDFYDLKGDVEKLLQLSHYPLEKFHFKPTTHPALQPGQTAALYREKELIGLLGALHPSIRQQYDILEPIFMFEFNLESILAAMPARYQEISKFPGIRRDLALLVDRELSTAEIQATMTKSGGEWLRQIVVFDVYLGEGIPKNKKSVAFALILQHPMRTLRDEEVAETMGRIIKALQQTWGIELRG